MMRAAKPDLEPKDSFAQRIEFLTAYQNASYAKRYQDIVARIATAESEKHRAVRV
jgi:hypothetical protein